MKVVVSAVVFHRTTAPVIKLLPFTVKVKAAPPAVAELGFRDVIAGGGEITNDDPLLVSPLERTVIVTVPAAATNIAGMAAVSCVALTESVTSAAPFH